MSDEKSAFACGRVPSGGTLRAVEPTDRDDLRRLALWLSRRRAVDEAVQTLTAYGPAACDRVHSHLDALRSLLALEQEAFVALEAAAPAVPQVPLPAVLEARSRPGATVLSLLDARERHSI